MRIFIKTSFFGIFFYFAFSQYSFNQSPEDLRDPEFLVEQYNTLVDKHNALIEKTRTLIASQAKPQSSNEIDPNISKKLITILS